MPPEERLSDLVQRLEQYINDHPAEPFLWEYVLELSVVVAASNDQTQALKERLGFRQNYQNKSNR